MSRSYRSLLVFLFDLGAAAVAWLGGFFIRFNFIWPQHYEVKIVAGLVVLLVVHACACWWAGLYRGLWLFASLPDLKRVLKAVGISTLGIVALLALDRSAGPAIPRSMLLLYPMLLLLVMGGGRAAWRMWKEHRLYGDLRASGKPVVVVGAGTGGAMLVRELERSPDWRIVALVDDNPDKWERDLYGCPVVGGIESLPDALADYKAQHVILAMPSAAADTRRHAADIAAQCGAHVFTVPGLEDLMTGKVAINTMRPVEIEDLLGREAVEIDTAHVQAMIKDKCVLVTGAGGSIGGELCRQIARFSPARILLFEANEYGLYRIEQQMLQYHPNLPLTPLAGDVKDEIRISEIFDRWKPQIVFHAAAYKHVPLMEVNNAWQAVRNNIIGTTVVAEAAQKHGADRFVLISTDKAVNPTNVMGATKRMAEMVCQALHDRGGHTEFEIVRFGNVLGSTGSVIPRFREQIAAGGPVTVTHPEITRYFMSIPEAAQLVLQAAAMGKGGEIFVLDMGEPVKIIDLARNMIRLSGFSEDEIRIEYTGLRPGEKLYEELLADEEATTRTAHEKLRVACTRPAGLDTLEFVQELASLQSPVNDELVRHMLSVRIAEYAPSRIQTKDSLNAVTGAQLLN